MSQLTTHILDTSIGEPAAGISVILYEMHPSGSWKEVARGTTNTDGRIGDLLPAETVLSPNSYRLVFETAKYFSGLNTKAFYPFVPIVFEIFDESHYHVPLLLNPYGYSTYRGS